jgi:hypothetical protein
VRGRTAGRRLFGTGPPEPERLEHVVRQKDGIRLPGHHFHDVREEHEARAAVGPAASSLEEERRRGEAGDQFVARTRTVMVVAGHFVPVDEAARVREEVPDRDLLPCLRPRVEERDQAVVDG